MSHGSSPGPTPAALALPPFNAHGLLPPYTTTATDSAGTSPYSCSLDEIVRRFATSKRRIEILDGLMKYRGALYSFGFSGFQWIAGSFTEQIETIEGRDPRDVDVVTFLRRPATVLNPADLGTLVASSQHLFDKVYTKANYLCDAYAVDLDSGFAPFLVDQTRYWFGLFTHRRVTNVWKGIAQIPLLNAAGDSSASAALDIERAKFP